MSELLKRELVLVYKHLGTILKRIVVNKWGMRELLKSELVLAYKHLGTICEAYSDEQMGDERAAEK